MIDLLKTEKAIIKDIKEETKEVKTLTLELEQNLNFKQGQFILLSQIGVGESPFAISSGPNNSSTIEVTIQKLGKNTSAIHELSIGEVIYYRGPYGTHFPIENWKDKEITIIGGGIGMAPLRSLLYSLLKNIQDYKKIDLLYGFRSEDKILYKHDFEDLKDKININMIAEQVLDSAMRVGLVTQLINEMSFSTEDSIIVICGPHKMIEASIKEVINKGIKMHQVYVSLEMKMKCGVGICGRCNIEHRYICKDGPVFRLDEVEKEFL